MLKALTLCLHVEGTEHCVYMLKAYGHYQEASLHLRHSLELKPEFEPAIAALKDMESIPDTTIHVYTLLIIICLVCSICLHI
jgi:2-iminoacetate synthase ThiH